MKITAIEIDGVRYEPHKIKGYACENCDIDIYCDFHRFNFACEFGSEDNDFGCYKRVKQKQVMTKEDINKACNWLISNIDHDLTIYHNDTWLKRDEFIERFRKAMEG